MEEQISYIPKLKKDRLPVTIYTSNHKITGEIHLLPAIRLTDMLNDASQSFIAVTNASIYNLSGEEIVAKLDFLSINKNNINELYPLAIYKDEYDRLVRLMNGSSASV